MGRLVAIFAVVCLHLGSAAFAAQVKGDKPADPAHDAAAEMDELATRIFNASDRNRNHVLNKSEFANADAALADALDALGRQGAIGKPKKANAKDKPQSSGSGSAEASRNKLSRSNKVSQAEFTFYVHAAMAEADEYWREMRATADTQRKAMDAQRRAINAARRGYRYPY